MTISIWGWGSSAISICGWGGYYRYVLGIPELSAEYIISHAYSCVIYRDYTEIVDRETGNVLFRFPPDELSGRTYNEIIERIFDNVIDREDGWSCELVFRSEGVDGYLDVQTREAEDVIFRVKPDEIPERLRGEVLERLNTNPSIRSGGWPWESEPCIDE